MKTIVLIISGIMLLPFQSKATDAEAIFKAENGKTMILFMDGKQVNAIPKNVIVLPDLNYGNHLVSIKVLDRRTTQLVNKPIYLKKFHQSSFVVNTVGPRGTLGIVKIKEVPTIKRWNSRENKSPRVKHHGRHDNKMLNMQVFMPRLKNQRFDKDKVQLTQSVLAQKFLTTHDLILIIDNLAFESNKVDIAILAYPKIVDKKNFYKVENALKFRSSILKLRESTYRSSGC